MISPIQSPKAVSSFSAKSKSVPQPFYSISSRLDSEMDELNKENSPLHEIINRPSVFFGSTSSSIMGYSDRPSATVFTGRVTVNGNDDLLSRIEILEREKLELVGNIHLLEERDRVSKLNNDALSMKIKCLEASRSLAERDLVSARQEFIANQSEKEELIKTVRELSANQQDQNKNNWRDYTISGRELKRTEEELKESRKQSAELLENNRFLLKQIEDYKEKVIDLDRISKAFNEEKEKSTKTAMELELVSREFLALSAKVSAFDASNYEYYKQQISEIQTLQHENETMKEELQRLKNLPPPPPQKEPEPKIVYIQNDVLITEQNEIIEKLQRKLQENEQIRRRLHNQIQELKGNVRVYIRCRPLLKSDIDVTNNNNAQEAETCVKFHGDGTSISIQGSSRGAGQIFTFDQIFHMESSQEDVYSHVTDLIQSALDGYRVCIFSYGQTGSGKTHTMSGGLDETRGIIPRAMEQIITYAIEAKMNGWETRCSLSMVELYNEELRDLISNSNTNTNDDKKLKISQQNGRVTVQGLETITMNLDSIEEGYEQLQVIMNLVAKNRMTASTNMNETSSRSHVVFMLELFSHHRVNGIMTQGGLRLVDLAGSERLDRSGTLGSATRLRETVNINKSLLCLTDVFLALSSKANHVPYRNSKLTMLLQDCLSGDGKALMIANISPTLSSAQETFCSLKFASQVNQVDLGRAQKNLLFDISQFEQKKAPQAVEVPAPQNNPNPVLPEKEKSCILDGPKSSSKPLARRVSIRPTPTTLNIIPGRTGRPSGVYPVNARRVTSVPIATTTSTTSSLSTSAAISSDSTIASTARPLSSISENSLMLEHANKKLKTKNASSSWR